jgi:SAM-dependent methyltransferase
MGIVDTIAGHPAVFNAIQDLAGRRAIVRRLQPWLDRLTGRVLDVGGGTGRLRGDLPPDVQYICVDLEARKLRYASGALLADAAALPFASATMDGALLFGVLHHLTDEVIERVIDEIARVLEPGGRVIAIDPISVPAPKLTSRGLWRLDRGHHLRSSTALDAAVRRRFTIEEALHFDVFHHYFAANCVRFTEADAG